MKALVTRIVANTLLRGEDARNRIARWSHWFPRTPTVDASRFQRDDEAYPRHWREFPSAWPPFESDDPAVKRAISSALDELPDRWREAVIARDVHHLSPAEAGRRLGVSPEQERALVNRARANLRARLEQFFSGRAGA
jgi:DNA-directed RNA polymerase specialized sigma24 family protein